MSNPAQTALSEGFTVLLATAGETVTFRGLNLTAVVNLDPQPKGDEAHSIDFTAREWSEIEIEVSAVASIPKSGEFFTVGSKRHRIEKVFPRGDTYFLRCIIS